MNPFKQVIADLGLTSESGGTNYEYSWLYLLLSYAAAIEQSDPQESTYSNPYREVLHRFSAIDGFAAQRLAQILNQGAMS